LENLEELAARLAEGMEAKGEDVYRFLDAAALVSDADQFEGKPGVTLITLHSTKGLEFDHVFLTEWKKAFVLTAAAITRRKGNSRKRRLVYVGMTRNGSPLRSHAPSTGASSAMSSSCAHPYRALSGGDSQ